MRVHFLLLSVFSFALKGCNHEQKPLFTGSYYVDNKISHLVEKRITMSYGVPSGFIDLYLFINDSLVSNNAQYVDEGSLKNQLAIWATLDGDTANISFDHGLAKGVGFNLSLFGDTCLVTYTARSNEANYKLPFDNKWNSQVTTNCRQFKLTLVNKPRFEKQEVIEGMIELTSNDYHILSNNVSKKMSARLLAFFKTVPLQASAKDLN
ncbi:MAG: hypothetical protein LCH58_03335 [Bacteroidetes bacterium]|nr:hypothetical protein [Bacteroidota bacterium]